MWLFLVILRRNNTLHPSNTSTGISSPEKFSTREHVRVCILQGELRASSCPSLRRNGQDKRVVLTTEYYSALEAISFLSCFLRTKILLHYLENIVKSENQNGIYDVILTLDKFKIYAKFCYIL